ncbi:PEP-CTERM sorting domain-containing protein [Pseudoduganella lutea]|uniref:PEP-CTERM sorting domain-containing protein n=1 Tax=Pseudoduganella lutea TaxID=321985 RepID=A0A4P6KWA2_9BURK|nr:PEP-CTERM sorting domain-containing protein [Pseudoduganella lutea]QBE63439.1 PEP-CTERM sorting domain-containing protein [Pseudoduganella lutea]
MHRTLTAALAIASAVLIVPSIHAAPRTSGAGEISNVQYTLVDLTPDDGNASYYQFGPRTTLIQASISVGAGNHGDGSQFAPTFPVPVTAEGRFFDFYARASTNGQLGDLHSAADTGALQWQGDYARAAASQTVNILLSAHSAFTVSGVANTWLSTTDPAYPVLPGNAETSVSLGYASEDRPSDIFSRNIVLGTGQSYDSFNDTFSLTARNDFDHDIELTLYFNTLTSVYYDVSAVPEPATYLMFGAGLAVLAGAMRRRQRVLPPV